RPDGLAVPRRLPRCGTASTSSGSKSSLKSGQEGQRSTLDGVDVYAPGRRTPANPSSLRANARRNSHCVPTLARRNRGRTPSHLSAIPPPRGRPCEGTMYSPFRVEYLDMERLLPVLVRKVA